MKFNDDLHLSNQDFGTVGCIKLTELNLLETEMVSALNFNLIVSVDEFYQYMRQLARAL